MVENDRENRKYPKNLKTKLRCLFFNLHEEIMLAILMYAACVLRTAVTTFVILITMILVFTKPFIALSPRLKV